MQFGIIFATLFEARPFLDRSRSELVDEKPFKVYLTGRPERIPVIVSGIGKVLSAVACHHLLHTYPVDFIINAGSCGALHDKPLLDTGSLVHIASAVEGDHVLNKKHQPPIPGSGRFAVHLPSVRLVTSDKPVFEPQARRYFSGLGDVVDMEGGAIARTAALYGKPWDMIKGISDAAGQIDPETLRSNIISVCEKIALVLLAELTKNEPKKE